MPQLWSYINQEKHWNLGGCITLLGLLCQSITDRMASTTELLFPYRSQRQLETVLPSKSWHSRPVTGVAAWKTSKMSWAILPFSWQVTPASFHTCQSPYQSSLGHILGILSWTCVFILDNRARLRIFQIFKLCFAFDYKFHLCFSLFTFLLQAVKRSHAAPSILCLQVSSAK